MCVHVCIPFHSHTHGKLSPVLTLLGLFPYQVALSQIAPGEHHLRVLSRVVGEPIPDEILGGTQFELPRTLPIVTLHRVLILT